MRNWRRKHPEHSRENPRQIPSDASAEVLEMPEAASVFVGRVRKTDATKAQDQSIPK